MLATYLTQIFKQVLCKEIGRRPIFNVDVEFNRESHSLSAGLALGMVMLGMGQSSRLPDAFLTDSLFSYIEGGRYHLPTEPSSQHRVREPNMINTDVTAPSALMALTLMFLKSNNSIIASRLEIQNSTVCCQCIFNAFLLN